MSFKSEYLKYCKAIDQASKSHAKIAEWFSDLDLDFSINNHAGDGVCILNHDSGYSAIPSWDQILRLSKVKSREDAMIIISEMKFYL